LKPRLSFLVAFSSAFGYVSLGGFLVSGSAVTINQILEVELDKKMDRTKNRPLPTGRISIQEATIYSIITGLAGLGLLLVFTNVLTTILSLISLILYSFVYTPLKRVGPIAVFVGAIPGALPPLLGWVAATNGFSIEAWIIFGIQFIWQFPHFWAIAWVADEDYKKAGFKLLPSGGKKDLNTAIQIMIYTLFLIPLGLLPTMFGITGIYSALVATICGVLFLSQTFYLMKECSKEAALKIMFGSFLYLPIVQVAYLLDKI
jgi:protoheme IX farnesyltransferase